MAGAELAGVGAAKLAIIPAGASPADRRSPREAVVVISNNGKGDRPVESLDVKAPVDRGRSGQIRTGGRATWQAVADANRKATKTSSRVKRIAGYLGAPSRSTLGEGPCRHRGTGPAVTSSPGSKRTACQEGMIVKARNHSPRRSRTAKASRISRFGVKSRCAREWGGWGRLQR